MSNTVDTIDETTEAIEVIERKPSLLERGLTTVEYAIGLLAAATAALVLLRIFNGDDCFKAAYDFVVGMFQKVASAGTGGITDILGTVFKTIFGG